MFKICSVCDFEWHTKDGTDCPACNDLNFTAKNIELGSYPGGEFGTNKNSSKLKNWYSAVGLVTLVLVVYALVLS